MNDSEFQSKIEIAYAVKNFVESENRILILSGMFVQRMRDVVNHFNNILTAQICAGATIVVIPAARMSKGYGISAVNVYGLVYGKESNFHKKEQKYIHDKKVCNTNSPDHVYILGEAHLISDSPQDINSRRFGSGRLLNDLMEFTTLEVIVPTKRYPNLTSLESGAPLRVAIEFEDFFDRILSLKKREDG